MDEKEAEVRPLMGTIFLVITLILLLDSNYWILPILAFSSSTKVLKYHNLWRKKFH